MQEAKSSKIGGLDLQAQYQKYQNVLKDAKKGQVITRFPPEPSGYMHIGHAKASMINYHYSRIYDGKMILRFDDTNPSKEKDEYVQSITEDLKTLGIEYTKLTYTSDYFDLLMETMTKLIKEGKCYCDNTPVEKMRHERGEGIESACRAHTAEENLKIWEKMQKGEAPDYCVRAKGNMQNLNKCMRDPVFYRSNDLPHHRTGNKYKIYPTYDFACPIVDSIEGVTHTMRTNEYSDRIPQYHWVLEMTGLRVPTIYEFSRLNFVRTVLSKRKLQWFVDTKRVDGWDDPRFPTVRGILRRGLQVETLVEFMLEQGPSKNTNLQQWDKLWAINKNYVDEKAPRYTAIAKEKICTLTLENYSSETQIFQVPLHPKKAEMGNRPQFRTNELYLEFEDARELKEGEKITLMKWANCMIKSIKQVGDAFALTGEIMEADTDFKSTKKINWLPKSPLLVEVDLVEYDHLITVDKVEEAMDFESVLNPTSKFSTPAYADPNVKNLVQRDVLQFERRGFFVVDKVLNSSSDNRKVELIYIPDGKTKTMSNIQTKVDQGKNVLGDAIKDAHQPKEKKEKKEKHEGKEEKKEEKGEQKPKETKAAESKDVKTSDKKEEEKSEGLPEPSLEDFAKLDIRVSKIKECWKHPESEKLFCEKIDIGGEVREIGSGIQQFVKQEEMTEGLVIVLANLKMRKLAGFPSTGMVMCASNNDHTAVELMRPDDKSVIGERVTLEGWDGIPQDKAPVIDPKKKVLETVLPHLHTDAEGYAVFKGKRFKTSAGYIKAKSLVNAHIS